MEARFREGRLVRRVAFFAYLSFWKESKCFLLRTFISKKKSGNNPLTKVARGLSKERERRSVTTPQSRGNPYYAKLKSRRTLSEE